MGNGVSLNKRTNPSLSCYYQGVIIGIGGFGKIKEIKHNKTNQWYALKEYSLKLNKENEFMIQNELNIFKSLSYSSSCSCSSSYCPFIIQLFSAFYEHNSIYFILELLSGGDLRLLLNNYEIFNEYKVAYIISCIGSALHYLHCNNIIHRDIKPENIMFNSHGIPKLIDFGISTVFSNIFTIPYSQSSSGTKEYLAPEVFVPKTHYHSFESDFWSLGVVMYELLFYQRPYEKMVPVQMIVYSHRTYQLMWIYYLSKSSFFQNHILHNGSNKLTIIESSPTIDSTDHGHYFASHQTPISTTTTSSITNLVSSDLLELSQIMSDIDSIPLNPNLIFHIPQSNFMGNLISLECHDMLLSLLDVRLHKRIGANERFDDFIHHPWFESLQIPTTSLNELTSPIIINMEAVGNYIWEKYSKFNIASSLLNNEEDPITIEQNYPIDITKFDLPFIAKDF